MTDAELKQVTYKDFLCTNLRTLSPMHVSNVTCIKSFVYNHAQHETKLETIRINASAWIGNDRKRIKRPLSEGIFFKNRKIYALQNNHLTSNVYPKQFTLNCYFVICHTYYRMKRFFIPVNCGHYKISSLRRV